VSTNLGAAGSSCTSGSNSGVCSDVGSDTIELHLSSCRTVVDSSSGKLGFVLLPLILLHQNSQHVAPIATAKQVTKTVMPITIEGALAAGKALLLREGASCRIAERTAKAMGAMSSV